MMVFLDINNMEIQLYTVDGVQSFDFDNLDTFLEVVGNKPINYITNIMKVKPQEIASTVQSLTENMDVEDDESDVRFIHSTNNGTLHIAEIDMVFTGPGDYKEVDEDVEEAYQSSFQFRQLIKNGTLKIINNRQRKKLLKDTQKNTAKSDKMKEKIEKQQLDSILVDSGINAVDLAAGGVSDDTMDITDEVLADTSEEGEDV